MNSLKIIIWDYIFDDQSFQYECKFINKVKLKS